MSANQQKTKVTVNPSTPSQQIVARANAEIVEIDGKGRKITIRRPGILAQYRIVEAMGAESAANDVYRNMCMPLLYVAAIDGDDVFMPTSKRELEALIQRLDEDGMIAVQVGISKLEPSTSGGGEESAKN